jgi:hypothetical protein
MIMSTSYAAGTVSRPIRELFEECIEILRQDAAEYGYAALIGAVAAAMFVVIPTLIGGPIALSIVGPAVALITILTFSTAAAALGSAANQLQPDAVSAFLAVLRRGLAVLRPWLPLLVALGVGGYAADFGARYMGPAPHGLLVLALAAVAGAYAFPRALYAAALFDMDASSKQALSASAAITRVEGKRLRFVWTVLLVPTAISSMLALFGGFDPVSGAVIAFVFVVTMPVGASLMSLVFVDAAHRVHSS